MSHPAAPAAFLSAAAQAERDQNWSEAMVRLKNAECEADHAVAYAAGVAGLDSPAYLAAVAAHDALVNALRVMQDTDTE